MKSGGTAFFAVVVTGACMVCTSCWPFQRPNLSPAPPPPPVAQPASQPSQAPASAPTAQPVQPSRPAVSQPAPTPASAAPQPQTQPQPAPAENRAPSAPPRAIPRPPRRTQAAPASPEPSVPAAAPPAPPAEAPPQLRTILTPDQERAYNQAIDRSLSQARAALAAIGNRGLTAEQLQVRDQTATFIRQANEARKSDLVSAKNLAERAQVLAQDLLKSLR